MAEKSCVLTAGLIYILLRLFVGGIGCIKDEDDALEYIVSGGWENHPLSGLKSSVDILVMLLLRLLTSTWFSVADPFFSVSL